MYSINKNQQYLIFNLHQKQSSDKVRYLYYDPVKATLLKFLYKNRKITTK